MPQDKDRFEDVYRISDVVRGAHSLVVIIGPQGNSQSSKEMLRQLGRRMWTFPEVLLSPANRPIAIYVRGCDKNDCQSCLKETSRLRHGEILPSQGILLTIMTRPLF